MFQLYCSQGLFPPGQGATIGVDFMIKTVEIGGDKVKVLYCTVHCYTYVLISVVSQRMPTNRSVICNEPLYQLFFLVTSTSQQK